MSDKPNFSFSLDQEGSESLINSAMLDARRRSMIQASIVYHMMSPLLFSEEEETYHYEMAFRSMCNFLMEISSKLSSEELEVMNKTRKRIQEYIDNNQVFKPRYNSVGKPEGKMINTQVWKILREDLFLFALKLKRLGDERGFGSPSKKDPKKSIIES